LAEPNSTHSELDPSRDAHGTAALIDLAVVLPTFNERDNIAELIARLSAALDSLNWELIFVDDDSTDGTPALVESYARADRRIRLLRRIGRRGLSSACIEGIMATSAPYVAVMDADLQHDETILPAMYAELRRRRLDVIVGTRNASGGSMGDFSAPRVLLSRAGKAVSKMVCHRELSDPMSGFFMVDRKFFLQAVRRMQGCGFKILLDMLASSPQTVRVGEIGYSFRQRRHGRSKLDLSTGVEYLSLIASKLTGGLVPSRFALFALVGAAGLVTHLLCLAALMTVAHISFLPAQAIATFIAMTENFFLNNLITFRDLRLRGLSLLLGLFSFCLACSFGAGVNLVLARSLSRSGCPLYLAGAAGIVVSSVWNYSVSSLFTWHRRPWPEEDEQPTPAPLSPELNSLAGERPKSS
jgi:dolichol-phosphate mannosyltransferase